MTPAEAQAIQDEARLRGDFIMWFVKLTGDGFIASVMRADHGGGTILGSLKADKLDELRAMLPAGLTRRERTSVMSAETVETWDEPGASRTSDAYGYRKRGPSL